MLSFLLVCEIVVIESCLRMSAVSLDSLVCATCARYGDGGLSRCERCCSTAVLCGWADCFGFVWSDCFLGLGLIFGSEVILDTLA